MPKASLPTFVGLIFLLAFIFFQPVLAMSQAAITSTPYRPTHTPTVTIQPDSTARSKITPDLSQSDNENNTPDRLGNVLLGIIITLGIIGAAMMVVGYNMRRNSKLNGS